MNEEFNEIRRQLIFEALDNYPEHGNMTIAKMLYRRHPQLWSGVEAVRNIVRMYRGALGTQKRKSIKYRKYVREQIQPPDII